MLIGMNESDYFEYKMIDRLLCCQGNMSLPWSHEPSSLVNEVTSSSTSSASRGDVRVAREHVLMRKLLMEGEHIYNALSYSVIAWSMGPFLYVLHVAWLVCLNVCVYWAYR